MKYEFSDTDPTGRFDYDISGAEYTRLMEFCCNHSKTLCLRFSHSVTADTAEKFDRFLIQKPNNIDHQGYASGVLIDGQHCIPDDIRYFAVCEDLTALLVKHCNSIWQWIDGWGYHNPSDPTFYREDGSVLFSSVIHDGKCVLTVAPDENAIDIVGTTGWKKIK